MGSLGTALEGSNKVALDTNCIIYLLEENFTYFNLARELFDLIEAGQIQGITSTLAITEVLTNPYKLGDYKLANEYKILFRHFPNLSLHSVDTKISERAAWIRASYGIKTPDAIFLATALVNEADLFISNDHRLKSFKELPIACLEDYL